MTATANYGWTKPDATTNVRIWEWVGTFMDQQDASLAAEAAFRADLYARRTSDLAVANNTIADDAQIQFTNLVSGALYEVRSFLFYEGSTTGDFKVGWSCSGSGAAFNWTPNGLTSAATGDGHDALTLSDTYGFGALSSTTQKQTAQPGGILEAGTGAGITFKLRWSQNTTDAVNGTTLFAKSTVILHRLA